MNTIDSLTGYEIAIVGIAGRFPGASSPDQLWKNLCRGIESISFFSDKELQEEGINETLLQNPDYVKAGGYLENTDVFDARFFGFTPREAELMDPQHRLFLECAWEALEDANCHVETVKGGIGVYAGCAMSDYYIKNLLTNQDLIERTGELQAVLSNDKDYLATQVSYKLDLKGPAITIQTACSTSLVAVHLACQGLLAGECDVALAGGVSIKLPSKSGYLYQIEGIRSPDGHCRAFDANAQGTVGGNGLGIVTLKRLEDALRSKDHVYAVIKGSAINNDGSLKLGYTAPSVTGQAKVIIAAQSMAEFDSDTISYVETHGTGTALGDPVEIRALSQAFAIKNGKKHICAIGSIKTNIGHLNTAAGVAGLIKASLALNHQQIPPSLHYQTPNPEIDFANSPFYVNTTLRPWPTKTHPRRAGVSSFGLGGTNAHVVLEEAPTRPPSGVARSSELLLVSAKTDTALEAATHNLAQYLEDHPDVPLAAVAYSLAVGRQRFAYRRYVVCHDRAGATAALRAGEGATVMSQVQERTERPVMFMFTGQGAQYINMGLGLYDEEKVFRKEVDACCESLIPHLDLDLRHILYPPKEHEAKATQQLQETRYTQTALFVFEYALAKLWMSWGVTPQAMLGHSIGEYVAACLAGVFSVEDALGVVAARGRLMQAMPTGAMLSVGLSEKDVVPYLDEPLSLAAHNSPSHCVVSGPSDAIEALHQRLQSQEVSCGLLQTSHAFHSAMMDGMLESFSDFVRQIQLAPPQRPFVSNLTGQWITDDEATSPEYWSQHIRHTVRFSEGVEHLFESPEAILLEVGPGQTLTELARRHRTQFPDMEIVSSVRHPRKPYSDMAFLLGAVGQLWLSGAKVNWEGVYAQATRQRVSLPTYPFDRQRYWVDPGQPTEVFQPKSLSKKADIADWFYIPSWNRSVVPAPQDIRGLLHDTKFCWLIFADDCRVGDALIKQLKTSEQEVISVKMGDRLLQRSDHDWSINPEHSEEFDTLIQCLRNKGKTINKVVHLWGISQDAMPGFEANVLEKVMARGFYSGMYLAQALGKITKPEPMQWVLFSTHMHDLSGDEALCPAKATALGPCLVIPQEYPHITCRSVDIVVPEVGGRPWEKLMQHLTWEITADLSDPVVAYRRGRRWVQGFNPVQLNRTNGPSSQLREGGVYLITGGMGNVGFALADFLAKSVKPKLILTARSFFPAKEDWDAWLATHHEEDPVCRRIEKIKSLEALGAEVCVSATDVGDEVQMHSLMTWIEKQFSKLHGVIHAAAAIDDKDFHTIQEDTKEECERQFMAKVQGTIVLEKVLQGRPLDFCLLTSSLASVLGGIRFGTYAAANLFMDAFVQQKNQTSTVPWISVNWDGWKQDQLKNEQTNRKESTAAALAMTIPEGVETFNRIVSLGTETQVVVSTADLHLRMDQWVKQHSVADQGSESVSDSAQQHFRPNLKSAFLAHRDEMEQQLTDMWQQLLGIEGIGVHDDFFQLGGDSLVAIQFINQLRQQIGVELSLEDLFQGPTIGELAQAIKNASTIGASEKILPIAKAVPDSRNVEEYSDKEVDTLLRTFLSSQKPAE